MRRKDREMDESFALSVADKCAWASLSMTAEDGSPYCVPISPVRDGKKIYFHCATEGTKTDILRARPRVCLVCVDGVCPVEEKFTTKYESAVIFGTAEEVTDEGEKLAALEKLCRRYAPGNMEGFAAAAAASLPRTAVWSIELESVTGKCKK